MSGGLAHREPQGLEVSVASRASNQQLKLSRLHNPFSHGIHQCAFADGSALLYLFVSRRHTSAAPIEMIKVESLKGLPYLSTHYVGANGLERGQNPLIRVPAMHGVSSRLARVYTELSVDAAQLRFGGVARNEQSVGYLL